jgi:hypothetical protein
MDRSTQVYCKDMINHIHIDFYIQRSVWMSWVHLSISQLRFISKYSFSIMLHIQCQFLFFKSNVFILCIAVRRIYFRPKL